MGNSLEKRVRRIEVLAAEKEKSLLVCNCRLGTRHHGSACLGAIMKGISRACPLHGFRELGFFMWTPESCPLVSEDNQVCPCPRHPWRSFVLNGPHTWEERVVLDEVLRNRLPTPSRDLEEDNRRSKVILTEYFDVRQHWVETSGRPLVTRKELMRRLWGKDV